MPQPWVWVTSVREVQVFYEGQALGTTPMRVQLPTGCQTLRLERADGTQARTHVTVRARGAYEALNLGEWVVSGGPSPDPGS